ncbi:NADPH2:quinone reductase [Rhizobiales bacterium GAS191]|nr:NADPH2:quinone reductase [Rhizobiales bacterium GAS191]
MPAELPKMMTAIAIKVPGGPEALVPEQRPLPVPGKGEIVIRVAAAGVNRPDVIQRQGHYPPPPGASDLPGLEVAGEVAALGEGATRFRLGDKVCALVPGGGYAQFCKVDETNALPIPKGLSMIEAAAIPETFFTVWTNVFERGRLSEGETLLVHGGSSGIGTTAIMLAKAFGARVIATAGSPDKCRSCRELGADVAIDYRSEDFVAATKAATDGKGADVILDMVGGDYVARNYEAAAEEGRIVQIAFLKESKVTLDLRRLMMKRLTHTGSTLRPRSPAQKAAIARALQEKVWPLLAEGRCKPVIYATFRLEEAPKAHALMESSAHIGKIVLTLD